MDRVNHLDLLTLVIALSAYLATIRLVVISRLAAEPPPRNAAALKTFLRTLIPADLPLVLAGVFLFLLIFWDDLFGGAAPGWFEPAVVWAFFVAVLVLVAHHAVAWVRSF
jgi:hypothetical protein